MHPCMTVLGDGTAVCLSAEFVQGLLGYCVQVWYGVHVFGECGMGSSADRRIIKCGEKTRSCTF